MPAEQEREAASALLCDITKSGKLIEFGLDPFTQQSDNVSQGVQTDALKPSKPTPTGFKEDLALLKGGEPSAALGLCSSASQVLRLAVGLFGLEVHEKPQSWGEVWLTFQDSTGNLGLKSPGATDDFGNVDAGKQHVDQQMEWHFRVLSHLRERQLQHGAHVGSPDDAAGGGKTGLKADFQEQLDLSEFVLKKVVHAVGVLLDPGRDDRPMVLREYTEEMVMQVCKDLRQWLEQLATLLSLYHVHILDVEAERRRLAAVLDSREAAYTQAEEDRKDAVLRHDRLQEMWKEEKMKQRAEALLGISAGGADAKIYTQRDVDQMMRDWEREHVHPLEQDIKELREAKDELLKKLAEMKEGRTRGGKAGPEEGAQALGSSTVAALNMAMGAIAERVPNEELSKLCLQLGESVVQGGDNIKDVLRAIMRLKVVEGAGNNAADFKPDLKAGAEGPQAGEKGKSHPAAPLLAAVTKELEALTNQLQQRGGADKLAGMVGWARDTITAAKNSLGTSPGTALQFKPAPKWDLGQAIGGQEGATKTVVVNDTSTGKEGGGGREKSGKSGKSGRKGGAGDSDDEEEEARRRAAAQGGVTEADALKAQLAAQQANKMKQELQNSLAAAEEAAQEWKRKYEELWQRFNDEMAKADKTLAELRKRLLELERLLKEKGLGPQTDDAIWQSGLSDFMQGKDVFERLYRDALNRMRRLAEAQARIFEETSTEFLRVLSNMMDSPLMIYEANPSRAPSPSKPLALADRPHSGLRALAQLQQNQRDASPSLVANGHAAGHAAVAAAQAARAAQTAHVVAVQLQARSPKTDFAQSGRESSPLQVTRLGPPAVPPASRIPTPPEGRPVSSPSKTQVLLQPLQGGVYGAKMDLMGAIIRRNGADLPARTDWAGAAAPAVAKRSPTSSNAKAAAPDLGPLPPLEIQGRSGSQGRDGSPVGDQRPKPRSDQQLVKPRPARSRSPDRATAFGGDGAEPPLSIGSIRGGSLLLPPDMRNSPEKPRTATGERKRPAAPGMVGPQRGGTPTRVLKSGPGSVSMPLLPGAQGPPRLLVQSVGSVYEY